MAKLQRILPLEGDGVRARWAQTIMAEMGHLSSRVDKLLQDSVTPVRLGFCAPFPDAGTTTTAANFAIYRASCGGRVALLETNLRRPCLAAHFGVPEAVGLWEFANGSVGSDRLLECEVAPGLVLVPAGQAPSDFQDYSLGRHVSKIADSLATLSDTVVLDIPALNTSPEAASILSVVDTLVLVLRSGRTRRSDVLRSIKTIRELNVPLAGILLNGVQYDTPSALDRLL